MKPAAFDYLRAETVDEAVFALAETGDEGRILAGGQSLVAMLNFRLLQPELLIDISSVDALDYVRETASMIEVGAATTQATLQNLGDLETRAPLLAMALPRIGHYQTRNRGTICGSLAHADPSSELPLCLAVLGGSVVLRSRRGERTLDAEAFQTGMLSTARAADEMIVAARFPKQVAGSGQAFREVSRRTGDFAIVAVAAVAGTAGIRFGVGGVADRPIVRDWEILEGSGLDDALNALAWELGGDDDIHATARYRREQVRRQGRRVIEEAMRCRA
jgi:2-furoyl-CoA dehydrogenase FAD binding subunit